MIKKTEFFIVISSIFVSVVGGCIDVAFETNIDEANHNIVSSTEETSKIGTETPIQTATVTIPLNSMAIASITPVVEDGIVKFVDEFTGISYGWDRSGHARITDNVAEIWENRPGNTSGIAMQTGLKTGMGAVFMLKFTKGEFNVYLADQSTGGTTYVGIKTNTGFEFITSVSIDNHFIGGELLKGNLLFSADTWYLVLIRILEGGAFYVKIWDKDNPREYREAGVRLGHDYESVYWHPAVIVTEGKVIVDYYQELEFK